MLFLHIKQCHAQHCTVGGDERQENAQNVVQQGAGFMHHHFGELHDYGDHQNKHNGAHEFDTQRREDILIDQKTAYRGQRQYECGCQRHTNGGFQFAGHTHKRTQAEELHQYKIIDQYGT